MRSLVLSFVATAAALVALASGNPLFYDSKPTAVVSKVDFTDSTIDHDRISPLVDIDAAEEPTSDDGADPAENEIDVTDKVAPVTTASSSSSVTTASSSTTATNGAAEESTKGFNLLQAVQLQVVINSSYLIGKD
ncbi:hypothetical protein quinque_012889 [Culex quinquefasciatus]